MDELLYELLKKLESSYQKLIELASLKKEAILVENYDELLKIITMEQKYVNEIESTEKERINLINKILTLKNLPKNTTLVMLINNKYINEKWIEKINEVRNSLLELTTKLKNINEEISTLISISKNIIEKCLNFIKEKIGKGNEKTINNFNTYPNKNISENINNPLNQSLIDISI